MAIEPIGPVVVGVDGSPASVAALDLAGDEAAVRVTPLVVVCAADGAAQRAEIIEAAVARALSEHPGISVEGQSTAGAAAPALLNALSGASLGVIGYPGPRAGAGSVVREVLAHCAVPVIVYRSFDGRSVELPRPVLVGVAATEGGDDLFGFAFEEAQLRGARVHLVHVWAGVVDEEVRDLRLADTLTVWSQKFPDVPVTCSVRPGVDAAVVLTAASRSSQLVVVGASRHRRAGAPLDRCSVAGVLIGRAACPVAVVAAPGDWS